MSNSIERLALWVFVALAGAAPATAADDLGCVVLLHGMARTSASMQDMADALSESGYQVANVSYPSRDHPIEDLAPMAVAAGLDQCTEMGFDANIHFVTHSLGGILVRQYYSERNADVVGRVVMLAPPNQGSQAADAMRDVPGFDWLNGPAGRQLGKGADSVPLRLGAPEFEFAVIAGTRTIDPITSSVLDDPDDGKVSVADTMLSGMDGFRVLPVSHTYIMRNSEVIELVRRFLGTGSFWDLSGSTE
jgi:pimeloyl-ACP methyl ester carboxylesterase